MRKPSPEDPGILLRSHVAAAGAGQPGPALAGTGVGSVLRSAPQDGETGLVGGCCLASADRRGQEPEVLAGRVCRGHANAQVASLPIPRHLTPAPQKQPQPNQHNHENRRKPACSATPQATHLSPKPPTPRQSKRPSQATHARAPTPGQSKRPSQAGARGNRQQQGATYCCSPPESNSTMVLLAAVRTTVSRTMLSLKHPPEQQQVAPWCCWAMGWANCRTCVSRCLRGYVPA